MEKILSINFKTYPRGTGQEAVKMAKLCEQVANETGVRIIIGVQAVDLRIIKEAVGIEVFSQHMDNIKPGRGTGHILPEAVKEAGADGVFLNHSEHRMDWDELVQAVTRAKEVGLKTIIFMATPEKIKKAADLEPDFLAIEPPELIAGDISVSTANPAIIKDSVDALGSKDIPLLCGAGVKTSEDVKIGRELGSAGAILASGVMSKTDDPLSELRKLTEGF